MARFVLSGRPTVDNCPRDDHRHYVAKQEGTLAARLSKLLQTVKNQSELSRNSGISRQTISAIASGLTKNPSVETLEALAPYLNTTVEWLRHGKDPEQEEVENLVAFHSWRVKELRQEERHLERVIAAEVDRQLNERWEAYLAERLEDLKQREPVLARALSQEADDAERRAQQRHAADVLDTVAARAVHQDGQGRKRSEAAAGRAAAR